MAIEWKDPDNLCPARVSGVLIGITLLYIFTCVMVDGILKISNTFQIASSSFSWRHLVYKLINFLMFAGGMFLSDEMTLPQYFVYSFGWVATISSLFYVCLLEDTYPYQLMAPFLKFSNGLSLDEWWFELQDAYDSQNLAVEMKYKLRVTQAKVLAKLVEAFESRMNHRFRNNANICRQSVWIILVNIALFIVNVSTMCQDSEHSFIKDLISVSCVVLSLALFEDYCDVQKGDYLVLYNKKLSAIKKAVDAMKPLSFKKAVKLIIASNRFVKLAGAGKGHAALIDADSYQYSQAEYEKRKKQCSEDVVEDCTNLFQFYVNLKKQDEAKSRSFSTSNEPLTVCEDPRALAAAFVQLVGEEIVCRTSKPEKPRKQKKSDPPAPEQEPARDTANTMSLIVLRVATELVTHLNNEIAEKDFSVVDLFEVRETLVQLWLVMALQKQFDQRIGLTAPQCVDALMAAAVDWSTTSQKPLVWTSAYGSALVEERSFQILYATDLVLNDNSATAPTEEFTEQMGSLMSLLHFENTPAAVARLWAELFQRDHHLEYMCLFGGIPASVTRDEKAAASNKVTEVPVTEKERTYDAVQTNSVAGAGEELSKAVMGFKSKADRFITEAPAAFTNATALGKVHPSEYDYVTGVPDGQSPVDEHEPIHISGKVSKYCVSVSTFFKLWWHHSLILSVFRSSDKMDWKAVPGRLWASFLRAVVSWVISPGLLAVEFVIMCITAVSSFLTVVRDSNSYANWVASDSNPLKDVHVLQIMIDRGGESAYMGYMSFLYFRPAQFMGQESTDFTRAGVISVTLVLILMALIPTEKNRKEYTKAIFTGTAIIIGAYMALEIRYDNLHDVTFLGKPAKYDFSRLDISLLAPVLYGMMHNCLMMWCFLPLTMCRALLTWIMDIPHHGEWISQ